jgi:hypothetical protein
MPPFFPDIDSFKHPDNGMTLPDMLAVLNVARRRNELILFRSTGPWSRRWIERGHPTKPFHVKGKSSDWGPHAGFVPHQGVFSKVGGDERDAADGDDANAHGIHDGFAWRVPLTLSKEEFSLQLSQSEGHDRRQAIQRSEQAIAPESLQPSPEDRFVWADRTNKGVTKRFAFWARWNDPAFATNPAHKDRYTFYVFPDFRLKTKDGFKTVCPGECKTAGDLAHHIGRVQLLEVMGTAEKDVNGKTTHLPLTGDYDLFAIGPHFNDYSPSDKDRRFNVFLDNWQWSKRKQFYREVVESLTVKQAAFDAGRYAHASRLTDLLHKWGAEEHAAREDEHKGNVTPRLLEVLNDLNLEMGIYREKFPEARGPRLDAAWLEILRSPVPSLPPLIERKKILDRHHLFRRAHHNEEAGRPFFSPREPDEKFGDGKLNDACPITVFQPAPIAGYNFHIGTLTDARQIREYFQAAYDAGYVLPKNPNWAMKSNIQKRIEALESKK